MTWTVAAAAVITVVGHIFPVWLGFRAGKGVATGLGVFLAVAPLAVLCSLAVFIVVIKKTRYMSLGSMIGAVPSGKAVGRFGAKPGDLIYVTGQLGGSILGLEHFKAGLKDAAVERHVYPRPRHKVGAAVREARRLPRRGPPETCRCR